MSKILITSLIKDRVSLESSALEVGLEVYSSFWEDVKEIKINVKLEGIEIIDLILIVLMKTKYAKIVDSAKYTQYSRLHSNIFTILPEVELIYSKKALGAVSKEKIPSSNKCAICKKEPCTCYQSVTKLSSTRSSSRISRGGSSSLRSSISPLRTTEQPQIELTQYTQAPQDTPEFYNDLQDPLPSDIKSFNTVTTIQSQPENVIKVPDLSSTISHLSFITYKEFKMSLSFENYLDTPIAFCREEQKTQIIEHIKSMLPHNISVLLDDDELLSLFTSELLSKHTCRVFKSDLITNIDFYADLLRVLSYLQGWKASKEVSSMSDKSNQVVTKLNTLEIKMDNLITRQIQPTSSTTSDDAPIYRQLQTLGNAIKSIEIGMQNLLKNQTPQSPTMPPTGVITPDYPPFLPVYGASSTAPPSLTGYSNISSISSNIPPLPMTSTIIPNQTGVIPNIQPITPTFLPSIPQTQQQHQGQKSVYDF